MDHANVLKEEICDKFLKKFLPAWGVSYKPKILCVGRVHHWSTDVWRMQGDKFYKLSGKTKKYVRKHHYGEHLGFGGYVASAGTCYGDSGGPLYQEQIDSRTGRKKYIVTGKHHLVKPPSLVVILKGHP